MSGQEDKKRRVRSREFRLLVGAQSISMVGNAMTNTTLYWLAIHVARGRALDLSILATAQFIPMLVLSRRAGLFASRHNPSRVMVYAATAQAVGAVAIGVPLLGNWMAIWYLCVLSFGIGCAQTYSQPAGQMFMLDLLGADELRRGTSVSSVATGFSKIIGPALAGFMIAALGTGPVFIADAASFLAVIIVRLWLARTVAPDPQRSPRNAASARRFRWILDLPRGVQLAAAISLLIGGFGYQFEVTNPLIATKVFHLSPEAYGIIGTFMAIGGIAGSFYSSRRPSPRASEFVVWALIFGVAECVSAVMPVAWAYEAVMAVIGATTNLFAITTVVYIRQAAPAGQLGQALSAYNSAFVGFVPAGAFVVAAIATVAGARWALAGPGLAIVGLSAGVLVLSARRSRATLLVADLDHAA